MLASHYDPILVAISFLIAILAASTALNMAGRVSASQGKSAWQWLSGGGIAMGTGIWAMHFIGMLAMDSALGIRYSPRLTVLSMVISVASSHFALWQVCVDKPRLHRLLPGALVTGTGVVAMHHTGMAAMELTPPITWDYRWVSLSVVIALLASFAALCSLFVCTTKPRRSC